MGAKAVYNNKGLGIYITGEDFETLLKQIDIAVPTYVGKSTVSLGFIRVRLSHRANEGLRYALILEQEAIDKARNEYSDAFAKRSQSLRKSNRR